MDEIIFQTSLFLNDNIRKELYNLIQNGLSSQLDRRLNELTDSIDYLIVINQYNEEELSLLMLASLNGNDDIVRILLKHYNSIEQVELKGRIKISNEKSINGATALYCACYRKHFHVAKTLIEFGHANVNQDTDDISECPLLLHATIMNRLDIVRFLIENKYSDVNQTKSYDSYQVPALILASYHGYNSLIEYLIQVGADVNYYCRDWDTSDRTSIAIATRAGHTDAVRLLYDANAKINIEDNSNCTLMMIAVEYNHKSIIEFLLERSINTIEDFELACCLKKIDIPLSIEQMNRIYEYLKFALEYRQLKNENKIYMKPILAYNYEQECQTIDELNLIKNNSHRILIEIILIRERIFTSRKDIQLMKILHQYGDWLVNNREFDKCLQIWIHMFYLYQEIKEPTVLHRFIWLFCKMFRINQKISVQNFLQVCQLIFQPSQIIEKNCTINNALFLVIIATKILQQEGITKDEKRSIYCWVNDLCRYQLTTTSRQTLLHLCVDSSTNLNLQYRSLDIQGYISFPNESALRLLLNCGIRWLDLNAMETFNGNTPLHIICEKSTDQSIIKLLLDVGCHIDCVNENGKTPVQYIRNEKIKTLLMKQSIPLNLKCLCAHLIINKHLNYSILESSNLKKFIDIHGHLSIQSNSEFEE